jgi:myo-inositol 2-dehydrogenase / D-chiro-inositol 1-dehydrogenase
MNVKTTQGIARRDFLKSAAAATATFTVVKAESVSGTAANSKIELGIIGCGGRGVWIGRLFHKHSNFKVVALADAFEDRLEKGSKELGVDRSRCYKGLEGYKELLASKVDAVAIKSPPCFHPDHVMDSVMAGKHVLVAKPVAVDVPGCSTIIEAGEKARGKVSLLVDFQTRSTPLFLEAIKRVYDGAIGKPVLGQVYYHGGRLGPQANPKDPSPAARLRNWVFDKALSGDIIVEQNVHVLDMANWFLKSHPVKAYGTGGRKVRTDVGDCWDHFVVTFWYPNDVLVDFESTQFVKGYSDLCARIFGSEGTLDSHYGGLVKITGDHAWPGGDTTWEMFTTGTITNIKSLEESIRSGKYLNNAEESAQSSLTTILGRIAAYENRTVTWDDMIKANTKMELNLNL